MSGHFPASQPQLLRECINTRNLMIIPADNSAFTQRLEEAEQFHMGVGKVHQTVKMLAKDLVDAGIDYAIIGAMALNAHGYRRETTDVDVVVLPEGLECFKKELVGRGYVATFAGARKSFRNTQTDITVEFITTGEYPGDGKSKPVAFPDPTQVSIVIDGINIVDLPTLINLKLASGMTQPSRRRDLADIQDLIRILGLKSDYSLQLDPYVQPMFDTLMEELQQTDPHREEPKD